MNKDEIKLGKYKHFKGSIYEVLGEGVHTETKELLVLYKSFSGSDKYPAGTIWARPKEMFLDNVKRKDYEGPRFIYIE